MQPICRQRVEKAGKVRLKIDLFPDIHEEQLFQRMHKELKDAPKKSLKNVLKPWMQERYLLFLFERNKIDPSETFSSLSKDRFRAFVKDCKEFTVNVNGTLSLDKAFVTGGGVSVKEIDPKKWRPKKGRALFLRGNPRYSRLYGWV